MVADDRLANLSQYKKEVNILTVEFDILTESFLQQINSWEVTQKLTVVNQKITIETNQPEHLRKRLLELSLRENLNINSLQMQTQSLEDVFRSLTAKS